MGARFLIDTNVLIGAQMSALPENALGKLAAIVNSDFTVSFISYIEYLGYNDSTSEMAEFISLADVIKINTDIIQQTIQLRKQYRIKLPDAIIAATALVEGRTILTRNTADFERIVGLGIENPWSW